MRASIWLVPALLILPLLALLEKPVEALPMYAQRSGRTCGNCHVSPTWEDEGGFENPDLALRKCTMSCVACHVSPNGGGLRNVSGRYFGQSTLAVYHRQERSYDDLEREMVGNDALWRYQDKRIEPGSYQEIPSTWADVQAGEGEGREAWGWGHAGQQERMDFWDGRYGDLNADPILQIGGDYRAAWWSGSGKAFPMQLDTHVAVQPVDHLTFQGTVAARGRSGAQLSPFFPRTATVMVHELPYMAYLRAGVFLPAWGLYVDDHTRFTRDWFEMDVSTSDSTVAGAEVGLAPNYPYASLAVFANDSSLTRDTDSGWGVALNAGYRDLGWSVGGHLLVKHRPKGASVYATGLWWGLNPFYRNNRVPLTYMGELDLGTRGGVPVIAMNHELWWLLRNGLNARLLFESGTPDGGQWQHRAAAGLDLGILPGVTVSGLGRVLISGGTVNPDILVQTHIWF